MNPHHSYLFTDPDGTEHQIPTVIGKRLLDLGVAVVIDEDDEGNAVDGNHLMVAPEAQWNHEPLTLVDLKRLADHEELISDGYIPTMDADDVLDVINYILSAPEWSASFLEDIANVVRLSSRHRNGQRTPRTEVLGAQWDSH